MEKNKSYTSDLLKDAMEFVSSEVMAEETITDQNGVGEKVSIVAKMIADKSKASPMKSIIDDAVVFVVKGA